MEIYLDVLFLINFVSDAILLLSVSIILRRNIKVIRILLSALLGSTSILVLFIPLNSIVLTFLKLILGILMILICFGYKGIKYTLSNLLYFFINSLVLGGFLYFINNNINIGGYALQNKLAVNTILLLILSPIIIYIYVRTCIKLKSFYSLIYKVEVYTGGTIVRLNGYYDTGNGLKDPYKRRNIIIVDNKKLSHVNKKILYVPCNTVSGSVLMKCFKPDAVYIKGLGFKNNILIGISKEKLNIDGVDCLLNKNILEGDL